MIHAGLRADAEKRIEETCVANVTRFKSDKFGAVNTSSLSQLFISFLEKVIVANNSVCLLS